MGACSELRQARTLANSAARLLRLSAPAVPRAGRKMPASGPLRGPCASALPKMPDTGAMRAYVGGQT